MGWAVLSQRRLLAEGDPEHGQAAAWLGRGRRDDEIVERIGHLQECVDHMILVMSQATPARDDAVCVGVCVCVCQRERERESVCVCVHMYITYTHTYQRRRRRVHTSREARPGALRLELHGRAWSIWGGMPVERTMCARWGRASRPCTKIKR